MKATELKLGDLVSCHGEILKVAFCDMFMCSAWDENEDLCDYINYDELSPIPLTEEILEKNGWEEGSWCFIKDFLTLVSHENKTKGFSFSVYGGKSRYNIKYVHELQHLLWALGMDDDMKI